MSGPLPVLDLINAWLSDFGLCSRGVLRFAADEEAPVSAAGAQAAALVLVGVAGAAMWPHFDKWRQGQPDRGGSDPLDRWSKRVIDMAAAQFDAQACYPSEVPYRPFQRWAIRSEGLKASPLGILIHPEFGLWHSYRGALLFRAWDGDATEPVMTDRHACDTCVDKPCLSACPVGAVAADGFHVASCRLHLATPAGQAGCMVTGCQARNACPVGAGYRYPDAQLRFHMQALTLPG